MAAALKRPLKQAVVRLCSRPPLGRALCWRVSRDRPHVALTFDDGPDAVYTPRVLDVLAAHGVKGTFFVLGSNVESHPELFERIVAEQHDVGIHGYTHVVADLPAQVARTRDVLARFGVDTKLFRPPFGYLGVRSTARTLMNGFSTVLWSVDCRDSLRHRGKASTHDPYDAIDAGDIILMHDDNPVCVADLTKILSLLEEKRLSPVRLSELLAAD